MSVCIEDKLKKPLKANTMPHMHIIPKGVEELLENQGLENFKVNEYNSSEAGYVTFYARKMYILEQGVREEVFTCYNNEVSEVKLEDNKISLAAIDISNQEKAILEIERCLNYLNFKGICLYVDLFDTGLDKVFTEEFVKYIQQVDVPVLFHPLNADDSPVYNESYLDTVYMVAKTFYLNQLSIYENENIILSHTHRVHRFLDENIGMLAYLQNEKWKIGKYMFDLIIKKETKGYKIIDKIKFTD